jgi:G3E family GTPase
VSGFLGCGKTTFLRHLIPLCRETGQRPALIVNEVGDVDVDGELLSDLNAEQVRLVGGCVCCTLQSQLSETIWDVLERKAYDLIIIECSGLSNPLDVIGVLAAPALIGKIAVSHVVCLLNSAKCDKLLKAAEVALRQVESADILILNKSDLLEDDSRAAVEAAVLPLAPKAARHWATYGDIGRDALLDILKTPAVTHSHCTCGCGHAHNHDHDHHHELPASFCTVAVPLPPEVEALALEKLLGGLPENVIRAKGFANVRDRGWQVIQKSYDSVYLAPIAAAPTVGAVLICIGQQLEAEAILGMAAEVV